MKIIHRSFFLVSLTLFSSSVFAHDVLLFDNSGLPVAIVDTDNQNTLYLESGQPIAYVFEGDVYSFAGKFMGSYSNGILWDKKGYMVAFIQTSKPFHVQVKPVVNTRIVQTKQKRPAIGTIREIPPPHPKYTYQMAPTTLAAFFNAAPESLAATQAETNVPTTQSPQMTQPGKPLVTAKLAKITPNSTKQKTATLIQLEKTIQELKPKIISFWQKTIELVAPNKQAIEKPMGTPKTNPLLQTDKSIEHTAKTLITQPEKPIEKINPPIAQLKLEPIAKSTFTVPTPIVVTTLPIPIVSSITVVQPEKPIEKINPPVAQLKLEPIKKSIIAPVTVAPAVAISSAPIASSITVVQPDKSIEQTAKTLITQPEKPIEKVNPPIAQLKLEPIAKSTSTVPTPTAVTALPIPIVSSMMAVQLEKSIEQTAKTPASLKNIQGVPSVSSVQTPQSSLFQKVVKAIFPEKSKVNEKTFKHYALKLIPNEKPKQESQPKTVLADKNPATIITKPPARAQNLVEQKNLELTSPATVSKQIIKDNSVEKKFPQEAIVLQKTNLVSLPASGPIEKNSGLLLPAQTPQLEKLAKPMKTPLISKPTLRLEGTNSIPQSNEAISAKVSSLLTPTTAAQLTSLEKPSQEPTSSKGAQGNAFQDPKTNTNLFEQILSLFLPEKKRGPSKTIAKGSDNLQQSKASQHPKLKSSKLEKAMSTMLLEKTAIRTETNSSFKKVESQRENN
jgi:hypothetical protein